jgi:hypothetical protein
MTYVIKMRKVHVAAIYCVSRKGLEGVQGERGEGERETERLRL